MITSQEGKNTQKTEVMEVANTIQEKINQIQLQIFRHAKLENKYKVNEIKMGNGEIIKTIYISSTKETQNVFYLGHGFGGTSLMYFPLFSQLIEKGSIVLWEIRGMGLTPKHQYSEENQMTEQQLEKFYIEGLEEIIKFYNHPKITFISHSFGAYITMNFVLKNCEKYKISKCILLSPIGVTPKWKDYKNKINSYLDIFHHALSWVGWKFNITYTSILKNLWKSVKLRLIRNNFSKFQLNETQLNKMVNLFDILTNIPGGSQKYFYKTIQPRVLPKEKKSIQQLIQESKVQVKIVCYYGGKSDWVDKQGAMHLSQKYKNIQMKVLQQCTHMLPLHTKTIKSVLLDEISD